MRLRRGVQVGVSEGYPRVQGYCPACGCSTLFVGAGGYLTCSYISCPDPGRASELLAERRVGLLAASLKMYEEALEAITRCSHDDRCEGSYGAALTSCTCHVVIASGVLAVARRGES